jgi:membrane associated rhomboid family serine protease
LTPLSVFGRITFLYPIGVTRETVFIIPINRDQDVVNTPRIVISLVVVNSLILLATYSMGHLSATFHQYGFTPANPNVFTLFTSMFLHAGFLHLLGNMWFLWMFGKEVENSLGMWLFAAVYLASGLGSAGLHYVMNLGSPIPCVGASGAISGVVGCFFVLFPKADFDLAVYFGWFRIKTFQTHTTAAVGTWIGEQLLLGLLTQAVRFSSTAFWGHIGGFIVGVASGLLFKHFVKLDSDGVPVERPWFIPPERVSTSEDELTQLKL